MGTCWNCRHWNDHRLNVA